MSKSRLKDALPFHVFARRRQVLVLFRGMLRAAGRVDDPALRLSLRAQIGSEFRQNRSLKDPMSLKSTLQEASRQLKQLEAMSNATEAYEADSWINQSEPDDERGRIGKGWPFGMG